MEVIRSFETLVLIGAKERHIPEDGILHSRRRENLKCYTNLVRVAGMLNSMLLWKSNFNNSELFLCLLLKKYVKFIYDNEGIIHCSLYKV
jgi:hypothetical protein